MLKEKLGKVLYCSKPFEYWQNCNVIKVLERILVSLGLHKNVINVLGRILDSYGLHENCIVIRW